MKKEQSRSVRWFLRVVPAFGMNHWVDDISSQRRSLCLVPSRQKPTFTPFRVYVKAPLSVSHQEFNCSLDFFFFALATVATAWQQLDCKYLNWFYEGLWICEHCSEALKYANTVLYTSTCCNKGWCWTGFFPFIYTLFCPDSLLYSQINLIKSCSLFF